MIPRDVSEAQGRGTSPLTSLSLLERARQWDARAWQGLVDVYAPLVYRWCRRAGVKADEASDVLQEVFSALARHITNFHCGGPGESFRGWLWTITRNKICDQARNQRYQPKALGGSGAYERLCRVPDRLPPLPADPQCSDDAELAHQVVTFVRSEFAERTWRAFWRLAVDGQRGPDVAAELGMSLQAVHQAKYRVLQRVRQEMHSPLP